MITAHQRATAKYYQKNKGNFTEYKRIYRLEQRIIEWLNDWNTDYFKYPKLKKCK